MTSARAAKAKMSLTNFLVAVSLQTPIHVAEDMSSTELMRYLHMSGRKVIYLLEHDYIPYVNTGKTTHKYQILRKDAESFKLQIEENPFLLVHLNGHFSSRAPKPPRHIAPFDYDALHEFLTERWRKAPDAMRIGEAAKLLGTNWKYLLKLNENGDLEMIIIMGKRYFFKENLIEYLTRPEVTLKPRIGNYKEVISEFKKQQCRVRENEKRRQKRAALRTKM